MPHRLGRLIVGLSSQLKQ